MDETGRKRSRPTQVVVDLKGLRDPWIAWCRTHAMTPSEGMRRVLKRVLDGSAATDSLPSPSEFEGDVENGRRRLEIRLTIAEHLALSVVAEREGMSVPRWLTGYVRLHLSGEQQFGDEEVRVLTRSSQVLLALGRNINQIARDLNQRTDSDELTLAQLEFLADLIKKHTEAVSAVLSANSRRWRR